MKRNSIQGSIRILLGICAIALFAVNFMPIWQIDLDAPQYPEGLRLLIFANKLAGNVDIINGLNHYIGMKHIDASMFPEFSYMKYILGALVGFGLLAGLTGKRPVLYSWVILLLIAATAGMYDFWSWLYDYGHNLDPRAAIIVPGMSYQPPLLGYKDLLNFRAGSFPDLGGYAIIISGFMAVIAVMLELLRKPKTEKAPVKIHVKKPEFAPRRTPSMA